MLDDWCLCFRDSEPFEDIQQWISTTGGGGAR